MTLDKAYASMAFDTSPEPRERGLEVWKETSMLGPLGSLAGGVVECRVSRYVVSMTTDSYISYDYRTELRYPATRSYRRKSHCTYEKSLPIYERLAAERAIEHAKKLLSMLELDMVTRMTTGEMKPDDLYAWCKRIQCLEDEETH